MQINAPCVVSLTWTLSTAQGEEIDRLSDPVEFLFGGDDLLAPVETALAGRSVGDQVDLHLEPEHAFGDYDAQRVCFEDRSLFPADLEAGMVFEGLPAGARTPDMPADGLYVVTEIYPSHVVLDANHPLAGIALRLHLQVRDIRPARVDEIEAKTVGDKFMTVLDSQARPTMH
jgi:FKBP-type peptidyl-prolyl cis-trans isomerase SlyD